MYQEANSPYNDHYFYVKLPIKIAEGILMGIGLIGMAFVLTAHDRIYNHFASKSLSRSKPSIRNARPGLDHQFNN